MTRGSVLPWGVCGLALACLCTAGSAAAQTVQISAANPNAGAQGTTSLVVKISGKNFAPGARTDFFLSGTTNPDGIVVHGTQWVSATEVDATIDIADTASLALFDIKVTNTSGRSGKGSDMFQVVQKPAGKPVQDPNTVEWYCAITFRDAAGDLLKSDGGGVYVNGVDGVTCRIGGLSDFWSSGRLYLQVGSWKTNVTPKRKIHLVGQSSGSVTYDDQDIWAPNYLEVWRLRMATSTSVTYLRPFRVSKDAATVAIRGDSFPTDPQYGPLYASSSSVFVTPLSACSWNVEFKPDAALTSDPDLGQEASVQFPRLLAYITGVSSRNGPVLAGYVPLPFQARVDVIGNKPGCP